ncbi:MAG: hypothetical protein M2R45_04520 [Verrucomicrobia subdivision 3 bacterium]|nr:hypothetical protein [Limisphaerales bacterium]MCS1415933.1 hypothetical protein [Limisphaerales bacterium]
MIIVPELLFKATAVGVADVRAEEWNGAVAGGFIKTYSLQSTIPRFESGFVEFVARSL